LLGRCTLIFDKNQRLAVAKFESGLVEAVALYGFTMLVRKRTPKLPAFETETVFTGRFGRNCPLVPALF
jgi:hypothetical protein